MPDIEAIEQFQSVMNVSRETIDRLKTFQAHLVKWNPTINLVGRGTIDDIWTRHFLDSAQLWLEIPINTGIWLDLGSGAGFPGLVIAAIAAEYAPDMTIRLVESDIRKSAFMHQASQAMGLSPDIQTCRVEDLKPQKADVISARALAPVQKLLDFSELHGDKDTISLFSKGKNHELELTEARKYWTFKLQKTASFTDSDGVILKIGGLSRV
jgi:16S rRNA (guanine527-N7)-methyltransferase